MEAAAPMTLRLPPVPASHRLRKPNTLITLIHTRRILKFAATNDTNSSSNETSSSSPPLDSVEIRFRRGSRRRYKEDVDGSRVVVKKKDPPKTWEEMSIGEKAMELYVGEKGALFWLNKFAYASIFIMIGLWILFRFVGPALNLYQLDTPPLAPTSVFKGA
ncbi:unnamed protein product [Rhodiola kirilowii]